MKKNESQKPISLEELLRGLRVQDEYQAKIISMQEETISLQNKQNEELAEMLDKVHLAADKGPAGRTAQTPSGTALCP